MAFVLEFSLSIRTVENSNVSPIRMGSTFVSHLVPLWPTTERKDGSNERVGKLLATARSPACILRPTHQWAYSLLVLTEFLPCQTPAHSPQISGSSPSQSNGFLESSGRRGHAFSKPSQTSTLLYVTFAFEVDE